MTRVTHLTHDRDPHCPMELKHNSCNLPQKREEITRIRGPNPSVRAYVCVCARARALGIFRVQIHFKFTFVIAQRAAYHLLRLIASYLLARLHRLPQFSRKESFVAIHRCNAGLAGDDFYRVFRPCAQLLFHLRPDGGGLTCARADERITARMLIAA